MPKFLTASVTYICASGSHRFFVVREKLCITNIITCGINGGNVIFWCELAKAKNAWRGLVRRYQKGNIHQREEGWSEFRHGSDLSWSGEFARPGNSLATPGVTWSAFGLFVDVCSRCSSCNLNLMFNRSDVVVGRQTGVGIRC